MACYYLKDQLPMLNDLMYPRKVAIKNTIRMEMHGFCGASERAYGACIYIRFIDKT
jgi:hypothetical protein